MWTPRAGLDVLAGGLAGSRILDLQAASPWWRASSRPGFRIDLHHKDMGIALAAARQADVCSRSPGCVAQLVAAGRAMGHGSLDHSALLKVVEQLSGRVQAEVRHAQESPPCRRSSTSSSREGVDTAFGCPGAAILPLYKALTRSARSST